MNKIATRLCLLWSTLLLTGCLYQTVTSHDIANAITICKSYGEEVEEIASSFDGVERVTCSNLITYKIDSYNLKNRDITNSYGNT